MPRHGVAALATLTHLVLPEFQGSKAVTTYWRHPCVIIGPPVLLQIGNRWGEGGPRDDGSEASKRSAVWQAESR